MSGGVNAEALAAAARRERRGLAALSLPGILLISFVHLLVMRANAGDEPELDQQLLLIGLGAFLTLMIGWIVSLYRRFRRPDA